MRGGLQAGLIIAAFCSPDPIVEVAAEADAMVTVFGILNFHRGLFFDESRRLDPAGAVTARIEMLRVDQTSWMSDRPPAIRDARPRTPAE